MQYENKELKSALGTSEDARLSLEGKIQHLHKEKSCLEGHIEDVQKQVHLINMNVHKDRKKTPKPHKCSSDLSLVTTTSRVIFIDICGQVGSVGSLLDPGFKSYLHEPHIAHKAQIPQFSTRSLGCKVQVKQL